MLFGRRKPASYIETLRVMLWPRRSWARSTKYMSKRILRLTASPHAIAAGVAAGMMASITPFVGFHFLIAFAIAYVIGGNFIAAATGTFFGNPISFPIIWASTHRLGSLILSGETPEKESHKMEALADTKVIDVGFSGLFDRITGLWEPVIKPMLVGSIPLGICIGILGYIFTRWASAAFNASRKRRRAAKLKKQQQKMSAMQNTQPN